MRFPVCWFFLLTFVLTIIGQAVNLYVLHHLSSGTPAGTPIAQTPAMAWRPYGFYLTNAGPSLVGLLMTVCLYGLPGARRVADSLAPWSVDAAWPVVLVCLFLPLLVIVVPFTILAALGVSPPPTSWQISTYLYGAVISGGLIGAGVCEELGWRGFALPHLQRRYSALVSSLIIGVMWALWHWPNYFIASIHPRPFWAFAAAIPMGIVASIIYTWAYNSTGGSLFAVVVLHGATVSTPGISGSAARMIVPLLYLIIAIAIVWRYGAENVSRRPKVVPKSPQDADGGSRHNATDRFRLRPEKLSSSRKAFSTATCPRAKSFEDVTSVSGDQSMVANNLMTSSRRSLSSRRYRSAPGWS